jgi:hypothetical protein
MWRFDRGLVYRPEADPPSCWLSPLALNVLSYGGWTLSRLALRLPSPHGSGRLGCGRLTLPSARHYGLDARLEIVEVKRLRHEIGRAEPQPECTIHLSVAGTADDDGAHP